MAMLHLSGPWGRGPILDLPQLTITSPDTAGDLSGGVIDQRDPQALILRLLASGLDRGLFRYTGSTSLVGPIRVGDAVEATAGFVADLAGNVRVGGDLTVVGAGGAVIGVLVRSMTNAEADPLQPSEWVQVVGGGPDRVQRAVATGFGTIDVVGPVSTAAIAAGAAGNITYGGFATCQLEQGLVGVAENQHVYLSATVLGAATTTAPTAAGQFALDLGVIVNAAAYVGTTQANSRVVVLIDKKTATAL